MHTDDLDQLLRSADPWPGDVPTALTREVTAQVIAADRGAAAKVRSRRPLAAVIAAALLVAVPTTAYASYQLAARTGLFGSPGMTEEDTSEWINVCSADLSTYMKTLPTPTDTPPAGYTWAQVRDRIVTQKRSANAAECPPRGTGVLEQASSLRNSYYLWAETTWTCRAVTAHEKGDDAAFRSNATHAAAMMDRLHELGAYGDDNWRPIQKGLRTGDVPLIKQFHTANDAGAGCP